MSDNITGSMVGKSASANAKASAAKVIADKVGMLLDVRGFRVTKQEPYSSDTLYGAKFTIEHECKLTEGRQIEARYVPGDDTFWIRFDFPSFIDVDDNLRPVEPSHYRMDYFDHSEDPEFYSKATKSHCEKLLEVWDDTVMKNIAKGRRYLRASDNPSPITDVTKGVKYIEGVWDQYTRMFRVHKAKTHGLEAEAKKMKEYISGMEKVFKGSHTHSQTYGGKLSRSYKTDNLGEIMVQMDYDSNGSVGLDSVTVPKGRATAFLKHMLRWKG
jgi:hypothetical protein